MEKKESKQQKHNKSGWKKLGKALATIAIVIIGKKMHDTNKPNA